MYTVQKYKLTYVRERENSSIEKRRIYNRADVREFLKLYLADKPIECTCIIALDHSNKITGFTGVEGDVCECPVYPTKVFRFLLSSAAAGFILAHNHPGDNQNPSNADWKLTEQLFKIGDLMGLPLLDHIIVTDDHITSMRDDSRWPKRNNLIS